MISLPKNDTNNGFPASNQPQQDNGVMASTSHTNTGPLALIAYSNLFHITNDK